MRAIESTYFGKVGKPCDREIIAEEISCLISRVHYTTPD